jgi:hypothetical protein
MTSEGKQLPVPFILNPPDTVSGYPASNESSTWKEPKLPPKTSAVPYTSQIPIEENYRIRFNTRKESQSSEIVQAI